MSSLLHRIAVFSARRRLLVIGVWLVAAVVVIGAAGVSGKELEDSFEVPSVDSTRAADLLSDLKSLLNRIAVRNGLRPCRRGDCR